MTYTRRYVCDNHTMILFRPMILSSYLYIYIYICILIKYFSVKALTFLSLKLAIIQNNFRVLSL